MGGGGKGQSADNLLAEVPSPLAAPPAVSAVSTVIYAPIHLETEQDGVVRASRRNRDSSRKLLIPDEQGSQPHTIFHQAKRTKLINQHHHHHHLLLHTYHPSSSKSSSDSNVRNNSHTSSSSSSNTNSSHDHLPPHPPSLHHHKSDSSIYDTRKRVPFWEAPLIVAVAATILWPAMLLFLSMCTMLVVTYFRLARFGSRVILRKPSIAYHVGDEEPIDVGLYWFGLHNHHKKWIAPNEGGTHTCESFDPNKPSVIYVHGFARRTTARRFRETFNWKHNDPDYGLDINAADRWIQAGWNVGCFYWNHYADEELPQDTECKIWTNNGRTGMRFRIVTPNGQVKYFRSPRSSPSISQQLADLLAEVFRNAPSTYRLVGHSLGHQVVVHATTLLSDMIARGEGEIHLPTRIALLDVYSTLGVKAYNSGWPIPSVVQRELAGLKDLGIILEQYQTSLIGRRGLAYRNLTACIQLDPHHIPWYKLRSRHIAAIYMYFLSFGDTGAQRLRQADLRRPKSAMLVLTRDAAGHLTGIGGLSDDEDDDDEGSNDAVMKKGNSHNKSSYHPSNSNRIGKEEAQLIDSAPLRLVPRNSLRAAFQWAGYQELEVGDFPALARATDEEVRALMNSGFLYKQWNGRLFLRVSRGW